MNELPVIKETYPYYEVSPKKDSNKYYELKLLYYVFYLLNKLFKLKLHW